MWWSLPFCRFIEYDDKDDGNLPFRKTQSMRATSDRRIEIVDHLKQQRRLSNSGEPYNGMSIVYGIQKLCHDLLQLCMTHHDLMLLSMSETKYMIRYLLPAFYSIYTPSLNSVHPQHWMEKIPNSRTVHNFADLKYWSATNLEKESFSGNWWMLDLWKSDSSGDEAQLGRACSHGILGHFFVCFLFGTHGTDSWWTHRANCVL